jgi:hypothetical protein
MAHAKCFILKSPFEFNEGSGENSVTVEQPCCPIRVHPTTCQQQLLSCSIEIRWRKAGGANLVPARTNPSRRRTGHPKPIALERRREGRFLKTIKPDDSAETGCGNRRLLSYEAKDQKMGYLCVGNRTLAGIPGWLTTEGDF